MNIRDTRPNRFSQAPTCTVRSPFSDNPTADYRVQTQYIGTPAIHTLVRDRQPPTASPASTSSGNRLYLTYPSPTNLRAFKREWIDISDSKGMLFSKRQRKTTICHEIVGLLGKN